MMRRLLLALLGALCVLPALARHGRGGAAPSSLGPLSTTLTLTPSQTNSSGPWTFGQALKDGDVLAGNYIACSNTSACQAEIRNYWPDGSAKFAVISGISSFTDATPLTIGLTTTSTAPSGSNVAEPTSLPNACVVFSPGPTGDSFSIPSAVTLSLNSVLGVEQGTWTGNVQTAWGGTSEAGKVREMLGPVMSEFDYYQPTGDGELAVWWYVRAYSNGATEIEIEVENGDFNQASPSQVDYGVAVYGLNPGDTCGSGTPDYSATYLSWGLSGEPQYTESYTSDPGAGTLTASASRLAQEDTGGSLAAGDWFYVNGSTSTLYEVASWSDGEITVASGETLPSTVTSVDIIGQPSHSRWGWVGWYSGGASVVPEHNVAYLLSTHLTSNYGYWDPTTDEAVEITPDSSAWTGLTSTINPAPYTLGDIDLDMSSTGYHQAIGILPRQEALYAGAGAQQAYTATVGDTRTSVGSWAFFYRDETTGRPIDYLSYPSDTFTTGWGTVPPTPAGAILPPLDVAHEPSIGYLAYLIEGRWSQLEALQFAAATSIMQACPGDRLGGSSSYPDCRTVSGQSLNGVMWSGASPITTRGGAWAFRTMAQAAALSPRYLGGTAVSGLDAVLPSADTESIHDTAEYLDDLFVPTSLGGGATGAWANTIGYLYQYDHDSASTTVSITTTADSTTVSASTTAVAAMWVGEFIDGPTSTTGLPAGDYVTSTDSSAGTFTVETAATTSGTYSVTCGTYGPSSQWQGSQWMVEYQVVALSYAADLGIEGLSNLSTLQTVRNFSYLNTVPYMVYGSSAAWQFPNGANYNIAYFSGFTTNTSSSPSFLTVAQQWAALLGNSDLTAYIATAGQDLYDHNTTVVMTPADSSNLATGYWGGMLGPLAYATDAGYSGASTAWATLTGAANYTPNGGTAPMTADDSPQFSIVPRTAQ